MTGQSSSDHGHFLFHIILRTDCATLAEAFRRMYNLCIVSSGFSTETTRDFYQCKTFGSSTGEAVLSSSSSLYFRLFAQSRFEVCAIPIR